MLSLLNSSYSPYILAGVLALIVLVVILTFQNRPLKYKRVPILTENEVEFFGRLRRALPHLNVFPQVCMAGVILPNEKSRKRWGRAFSQVSSKRIDFTICYADLTVKCVIELDDRTHDKVKDAKRDAMLASAGIRTIRYESRSKPSEARIHTDVASIT